jgi:selenocysteine-specific elongation factor
MLVDEMVEDGILIRDGAAVRSRDHGAALEPEQRRIADIALEQLREADASPPEIGEAGLSIELAKALERAGELVFVAPQIAYPIEVWHDIEDAVVELISRDGPATVSQVREAIGTTRKYAVPLLEKLDATGVTRRTGDARELGSRGRELAAEGT